ncbi:Uncharacterised protein [Vibrio cholerae]|nr:Uncharacterised protein [Vibrio cholerae]
MTTASNTKGIAIVTKATRVCLNAFAIGYE